MLGGLFPMHAKSSDGDELCGGKIDKSAIQLAESMLFAIDEINNSSTTLQKLNLTLGAYIQDSCGSFQHAIHQAIEFTDVFNLYKHDECMINTWKYVGDAKEYMDKAGTY